MVAEVNYGLSSYHQALKETREHYLAKLEEGTFVPWNPFWSSVNILILLVWLLILPSTTTALGSALTSRIQLAVLIVILSASAQSTLFHRSPGIVGSLGVGLNAGLCSLMAFNFLFARRVWELKRFRLIPRDSNTDTSKTVSTKLSVQWETLPTSEIQRARWILDLLTSVQGLTWSWNPKNRASLVKNLTLYSNQIRRTDSLSRNVLRFLRDYVVLDFLKCVMISDPYFLGQTDTHCPSDVVYSRLSCVSNYTYHICISAAGIFIAIDLLYSFSLLLYVNVLGPSIVGLHGYTQVWPPLYGTPYALLRRGLAGFWGETWHQILRPHFTTAAEAICRMFSTSISHEPNDGKLNSTHGSLETKKLRVFVVFLLSGALHGLGSYTLLGNSRPLMPLMFFALQPVGIYIQILFSDIFMRTLPQLKNRKFSMIRQATNFTFAIVWLYGTFGLFEADFSRGGVWLFEPLPVSIIRGFGFSDQDKRWWCWGEA